MSIRLDDRRVAEVLCNAGVPRHSDDPLRHEGQRIGRMFEALADGMPAEQVDLMLGTAP